MARSVVAFDVRPRGLRDSVSQVTDTFEPSLLDESHIAAGTRGYEVCGVPIADVDALSAAEMIVACAALRTSLQVHLCNAYTLSLVDRDDALRKALLAADLNLPDGTPVAWLARRGNRTGPVRGPEKVGRWCLGDLAGASGYSGVTGV